MSTVSGPPVPTAAAAKQKGEGVAGHRLISTPLGVDLDLGVYMPLNTARNSYRILLIQETPGNVPTSIVSLLCRYILRSLAGRKELGDVGPGALSAGSAVDAIDVAVGEQ